MANYNSLKATIDAQIKANGVQAITGPILNSVLTAMINTLGTGYQYKGIATPATNPGTPDANVFYLASEAGTYTNFGGIVINEGEVCALVWNGTWTKQVTGAATAAQVNQLGQEIKGIEGYYVYDSFKKNSPENLSYSLLTLPNDIPLFLKVTSNASISSYIVFYYDEQDNQSSYYQTINIGERKALNVPYGAVRALIYHADNQGNTNGTYLIELKTLSYDQKIEETKNELQNNLNVSKVPTYKFFLNEEEQTELLTGIIAIYALKDFSEDSREYYLAMCGYRNSAPGQSYVSVQDGNRTTIETIGFDASTIGLKVIDCAGFRFIIDTQKLPQNSTSAFIVYHLHINKWAIPFIDGIFDINDRVVNKADKENLFHRTVNLFDGEIIPDSWILSTTGEVSARAGNFVTKNLIPVEYGKTYRFSKFNGTIRRENDNYYCEFNADGEPILTETPLKGAGYKVTNPNVKYIKVTFGISSGQTAETTKAMVYEWNARAMWMSDQHSEFYLYQTAYQEYGFEKVLPLAYSRKGRKMICFGDSITDFGFYPEYAGYILEMDVVNMGFGGMRMTNTANNAYDRALSMYELTQAVIVGDFTSQIAAATHYANEHPKWSEKISQLSSIDFSTIDVITIAYGVNDFSGGVSIGEDTDVTPSTIKGALNLIIEGLKTNYPKIQVIIIPPMYRRYGDNNETDSDAYIINTKKLPDVVEAEESVARLNHCEYLELYWTLGVNKYNWQTFLADGTHPNNIGYVEIGRRLAGYLTSH